MPHSFQPLKSQSLPKGSMVRPVATIAHPLIPFFYLSYLFVFVKRHHGRTAYRRVYRGLMITECGSLSSMAAGRGHKSAAPSHRGGTKTQELTGNYLGFWFLFIWDIVTLQSSGCPETYCTDQVVLEVTETPAATSRVLGLNAGAWTFESSKPISSDTSPPTMTHLLRKRQLANS